MGSMHDFGCCVSYTPCALIQCHLAWHRLSCRDLKGVVSKATEKTTHKTASVWSAIKKDPQTDRGGGNPSARSGSATMLTEI